MSTTGLRARLRRIERARAARDPTALPRAIVVFVSPGEDVAPHIAALVDRGEYRRDWRVLAIRADWPAVRAMGGISP